MIKKILFFLTAYILIINFVQSATITVGTNGEDYPTIQQGSVVKNFSPNKPINVSPEDNFISNYLHLTLTSSAFSDPDTDDTHKSSQWQLFLDGDLENPYFDSGETTKYKTSYSITENYIFELFKFYWHVRYKDQNGAWSEWSDMTSFTTMQKYFPPTDHNGEDLVLKDEDVIWGKHTNIGKFIVPAETTVNVELYHPDTANSGYIEIYADEVIVNGTINAVGAGYTGSGGGGGYPANIAPYCTSGVYGTDGEGRYSGFSYGKSGDGTAGGGFDGGYNISEGNSDESIDLSLLMGSGGKGSPPKSEPHVFYTCSQNGGAGGGSGGGYVKIFSDNISINGKIETNGTTGQNGTGGDCTFLDYDGYLPQPYCYSSSGGSGGSAYPYEEGEGGCNYTCADNGGAGAGGGILLYSNVENGISITGILDALGGRDQLTNGGSVKIFYKGDQPVITNVQSPRVYYGNLDENPIPYSIEMASYDFLNDSESWVSGGAPGYFSMPYFWAGNGVLMIYSADHNTYGYWEQPHDAVPYIPNSIYKATFRVRGTVNEVESPTLRCRLNTESATVIGLIVVESFLGAEESPGLAYKDYVLYLDPMDQSGYQDNELSDDIFAAVEIVNMWADNNPTSGFYVESVKIDRIDKALIPEAQTVKIYDTSNDFLSWEFGGVEPLFTIPIGERTDGSLTLTANNDNTNTYGYWDLSRTCNEIDIEPNKLYKVKFTVSSPTTQEFTPMLRLRINTESNKMAYVHTIYSNLDGTNSPSAEGKVYETYFYPPQSDVGQAEAINGLILGFDLANIPIAIPDDPNGMLKLDKVEVQTIDIALMP